MCLEQGNKQGRSKGEEVINVGRGPIMEGLMVSQALALPISLECPSQFL